MDKIPSRKSLSLLILFTIILIFSYSYTSWANSLDLAKEYRFKADKLQIEGKIGQAIEYYRKVIELDKDCVAANNNLGICYEKKGQSLRAEYRYQRALEINPQYGPAHYNLGFFYERAGDIKKAVFHWKQRRRLGYSKEDAGKIKVQAKLEKYAPQQLELEEAQELSQNIIQQKEKDVQDRILDRSKYKYRTKEEEIQSYYLEGMDFFQKGNYRETAERFYKMIDALPISN